MEKLPKQELREFSKEQLPEERKRIAKEVRERRGEYFSHQKETTFRIEELKEKIKKQEGNIASLIQEIGAIEQEIASRKKSKIAELLNYRRLKTLSQKKEAQKLTQEEFEKEFKILNDLLGKLQQEASDKTELEEAKKTIEKYYKGIPKKYGEYQEEEKNKEIKKIVEDYDVFFLHSTTPYGVPGDNSLLKSGTDWATKLKILLAFEPTISASTFQIGDSRYNMWAHLGVLLKGGYIETADMQDIGTRAKNLSKRERHSAPWAEKTSEQIRLAICKRQTNVYNEMTVRDPEVAGVYLCLDNQKQDKIDVEQIKQIITEFALPFYIIQNGNIWTTSWNSEDDKQLKERWAQLEELAQKTKKLIPSERQKELQKLKIQYQEIKDEYFKNLFTTKEKITSQDILKNDFSISKLKKEEMIEDLLVEQPFKPICHDAFLIESYYQGYQTFMELQGWLNPEQYQGKLITYRKDRMESRSGREIEGEEVKIILEYKTPVGSTMQFLTTKNNELFMKRTFSDSVSGMRASYLKQIDRIHRIFDKGLSPGLPLRAKKPIRNQEDYLTAIQSTIEKIQNEKQNPNIKKQYVHSEEWMKRFACHLYGFGEQAGIIGDIKIKKRAFALANSILPEKELRKIIQKRIDENGNFKVTLEDLKPK